MTVLPVDVCQSLINTQAQRDNTGATKETQKIQKKQQHCRTSGHVQKQTASGLTACGASLAPLNEQTNFNLIVHKKTTVARKKVRQEQH